MLNNFVHSHRSDNINGAACFYGVNCCNGQLRGGDDSFNIDQAHKKFCDKVKEGDIIDMWLDLNDKELKYCINDKDYGKAFDEMEQTDYRAAVAVYRSGEEVELVKYDHY